MTRREPHTPTAKEFADEAADLRKPPKWAYFPTGQLLAFISRHEGRHVLAEWQDGKVRRVEQMVREIVYGMLAEVDRHCVHVRAERERQRTEMEEARRRQLEDKRRRNEQRRVDDFVCQVERWETARRIRRFLRAARQAAIEQAVPMEAGGPVDEWFTWASDVANRHDPLMQLRWPADPPPSSTAQSHNAS